MYNLFKKYHKWIGIVFTLFIMLFSITGIILNHRELLSGADVSRKLLPSIRIQQLEQCRSKINIKT